MNTATEDHSTIRVPDAPNGDRVRPRLGWQVSCHDCPWDGGWWADETDARQAEDDHQHYVTTGQEKP